MAADVKWMESHAKGWVAGLSNAAVNAVNDYRGSDYYPINKLLRDPTYPASSPNPAIRKRPRSQRLEVHRPQIALLDAALAASVIDRPLVVHRGVTESAKGLCGAFDAGALVPGTEVTDAGFASTTLSGRVSNFFKANSDAEGPGLVMHVRLEPGQRAAHLGVAIGDRVNKERFPKTHKDTPPGTGGGEYEMLLPRNTTYRVLAAYTLDGVRHVDCEIARQSPPTPVA